ncbi:MAG TPA: hypothetical protein VFD50_00100, partial [Thermoleophilia bacterium]|nr:hypothetical protein [Thermoleophilia bacterium]
GGLKRRELVLGQRPGGVGVLATIRPRDPVRQAAWLFDSDWIELGDVRRPDDFDAYDAELARRRAAAAALVLDAGGLDAVARLAASAKAPHAVGAALAAAGPGHDADMAAWLADADADADTDTAKARAETAYSYVAARLRDGGGALTDGLLALNDDPIARALVLRAARDPQAAWTRLAELPDGVAEQYWSRFSYVGLGHDFPAVLDAARGLVRAGRHAAALDMMALYSKGTDSVEAADLAATALEGLLAGGMGDPELAGLFRHDFQKILALLGRYRDAVGNQRVVNLEWQLFPALGVDADAPSLHSALAEQPAFFAELVGYAYQRTDDAAPDHELDPDQRREMATRAYSVLRSWRNCPGAGPENKPDPTALESWTAQARERLAADARLGPGDREIGQALAWAAPDDDGTSPPRAVRDLLETLRSDRLDEGLILGILNRRGVTSRGAYDGGEQERDLADRYRQAAAAAGAWPRTRRLLRRLAESYDRDARREEEEAERLRRGLDD